jgi:hypothetical protein
MSFCAIGSRRRHAGRRVEDPEVQGGWAKLGNEIRILEGFEVLEKVELS